MILSPCLDLDGCRFQFDITNVIVRIVHTIKVLDPLTSRALKAGASTQGNVIETAVPITFSGYKNSIITCMSNYL